MMELLERAEVALGLVLAALFLVGGRLTTHLLRPHHPRTTHRSSSSSSSSSSRSRRAVLVLVAGGQTSLLVACLSIFTGRVAFLSSLDFVLRRVMQLLCPLLLVDASLAHMPGKQKKKQRGAKSSSSSSSSSSMEGCSDSSDAGSDGGGGGGDDGGGDAAAIAATTGGGGVGGGGVTTTTTAAAVTTVVTYVNQGPMVEKDGKGKRRKGVENLMPMLWSYLLLVAGVAFSLACLDLITCPVTMMKSTMVGSPRGRGNQSGRIAIPEIGTFQPSDSAARARNQFVQDYYAAESASDATVGIDIVNYVDVFPELVLYCVFYVPLMVYVLCNVWPWLTQQRVCRRPGVCDTTADYSATNSWSLNGCTARRRQVHACVCAMTASSGQASQLPIFGNKIPLLFSTALSTKEVVDTKYHLRPSLPPQPPSSSPASSPPASSPHPSSLSPPPSPPPLHPPLWKGAESGKSRREDESEEQDQDDNDNGNDNNVCVTMSPPPLPPPLPPPGEDMEKDTEPETACGKCAAAVTPFVPVACVVALVQVGVLCPLWTALCGLSPWLSWEQQQQQQQVPVLPSCVLFLPLYCGFCSTFWF